MLAQDTDPKDFRDQSTVICLIDKYLSWFFIKPRIKEQDMTSCYLQGIKPVASIGIKQEATGH